MNAKDTFKNLLGEVPLVPELYWLLRHRDRTIHSHFNLGHLQEALPQACVQVKPFAAAAPAGKRILVFGTLHFWIEEGTLISLALTGFGHKVTFAYSPLSEFDKSVNTFDLHRQNLYTRAVLQPARSLMEIVSLMDVHPAKSLPPELENAIRIISAYDVQYRFEVEEVEVDTESELYRLRLERNTAAARAALAWLQAHRPDVVIIPNGVVVELGVVYQVARYLGIPVVTYEFSEEREQLWLSQGEEVMHLNTDELWQARGCLRLTDEQHTLIQALEAARQGARSFGKSDRLWQEIPTQGSMQARSALGLDSRPIVLLATNVLGDSLILGRNIFSRSMAEWITRTVQFFAKRTDVQLVIRIHPGEKYTHGATMVEAVKAALPGLPENIHLIEALDKVNTYDLMELTSLGLVYVTTTGLEMVMRGIPVIVVGKTHYRQRGFTLDPNTWDEYFRMIEGVLADPPRQRPRREQVESAWNYAYRFFFEYPRPFPWRLYQFWKDYEKWPLERVLSEEGQAQFGATFRYLAGEPIDWKNMD